MSNTLQYNQPKDDLEKHQRATFDDLIREQILHALGAPFNLHMVQVRKVWDAHYRINVLVGADAASVRIANSYFLVVDNNGNLITATPKIIKQY